MMKFPTRTPAWLQRAEFLSPKDLLQRAGAIAVIFLLLHLAGLREFTSILNGTTGSLVVSRNVAAFLAVIYIIFYLAFVVLVPVMILAAGLLAAWRHWWKRPESPAKKTN